MIHEAKIIRIFAKDNFESGAEFVSLLYVKSSKMVRVWRAKSGRLQLPGHFLLGNDTKIPNAPHVRNIRNPTAGPLVTIPITFSRHTRTAFLPFFLPPAPLLRDFGDPINRPFAGKTAEEDIVCLFGPPKRA